MTPLAALNVFADAQEYRIRHRQWQPHQTFGRALPSRQTLVDAEHGTLTCYAKCGCRCLLCRAANAQYKSACRRALRQRQLAAQLAQRPAKAPARTLAFFRGRRHRNTHQTYANLAARRADLRAHQQGRAS